MKSIFIILFLIICHTAYSQINCNNWLYTPSRYSYVDIGDLDVPGNQITVEAVINRTIPYVPGGGDNSEGDIVSKHENPNDVNYLLRPNHASITTSNGFYQTPDIAGIELNKTYHVAMVYDGDTLKLYRNGCLMSKIAASGNLHQNSWNTRIGYYQYQYWNTNFIGYINEVRIWNVARSQAEIRAYMNTALPNPTTQTGLLAYYTFDNLLNKQGNAAYNGTLGGSASINQTNTNCNAIVNQCITSTDSTVINDYTAVLAFDPCTNILSVADASKYKTGDTVLIIQMKGAVIDSSNTVSFGTLTDYKSSGNYEYNIIKQKNGNNLTLLNLLERPYDIPNGKVQLVRVPYYQNLNITSTLTCLPWDGTIGGVLAFNVAGNVSLNANIDASGKGFRHGLPMNRTLTTLNEQQYFYGSSTNEGAQKGEGIYTISESRNYGRGASANGGGGGNAHNTGGGGGGNGGMGGNGGDQWELGKTIAENVGGKGGRALANSAIINKLFLGGSGGMGQANDLREYPSGNGGGIIIINAGTLTGNGFAIKSNGNNATEAPNSTECKDGMAGGGAGGSILLNVNNIANPAIVEARGGNGADHIANNVLHGPGGGGGGGVIAFAQSAISSQYIPDVKGGQNGVNTNHANDPYGATSGSDGLILTNFQPHIDNVVFRKNIDSVRFSENLHDCMSFDFSGIAFTQTSSISNWYWNFGDSATSTSQNPTHTYSGPGNYNIKLIVSDANGCKDSTLKTVTVKDISISKSPDTALCGSASINIFAIGGSTYSWTPAADLNDPNISNPVATPLTTTEYFVTVSDSNGCSKMDSVLITVNPIPSVQITSDTSLCPDAPLTLFASGGVNYEWTPAANLSDAYISNPQIITAIPETYSVLVTDVNGCTNEDSVAISIFPRPSIQTTPDTTICQNTSVQLFASGGASYTWSPAATLDDELSATPTAAPDADTRYLVEITDVNNCQWQDSVWVRVHEAALFSVNSDTSVCGAASVQLSASGGDNYIWGPGDQFNQPNQQNPIVTADTTQTYWVAISENTCNKTDTLYTTVNVHPLQQIAAFSSNAITCTETSSQLHATGTGKFTWSPAMGLSNSGISNPVASPETTTQYIVWVEDSSGCASSDTVTVEVNYVGKIAGLVPNAFTPNGDGINDCFGIQSWGDISELTFRVYNRYGQVVFATHNPGDCWNGTFKGKAQNSGAFVYVISASTPCGLISRKGTVILIR